MRDYIMCCVCHRYHHLNSKFRYGFHMNKISDTIIDLSTCGYQYFICPNVFVSLLLTFWYFCIFISSFINICNSWYRAMRIHANALFCTFFCILFIFEIENQKSNEAISICGCTVRMNRQTIDNMNANNNINNN